MKLLKPTLLATATSLALLAGGTTLAQMPHKDTAAHAAHWSQHKSERHAEHRTERQQQLKAALKLNPTQEAAWAKFVQAQQRPQHATPPNRQAWAQLSTPQRLDQMQARKAEHDAHLAEVIEATRSLYAVLDPEQQKVFDSMALMAGMGRAGHPHRGGQGHHGMHHGS